jgi:hypothetical protein
MWSASASSIGEDEAGTLALKGIREAVVNFAGALPRRW